MPVATSFPCHSQGCGFNCDSHFFVSQVMVVWNSCPARINRRSAGLPMTKFTLTNSFPSPCGYHHLSTDRFLAVVAANVRLSLICNLSAAALARTEWHELRPRCRCLYEERTRLFVMHLNAPRIVLSYRDLSSARFARNNGQKVGTAFGRPAEIVKTLMEKVDYPSLHT